MTKRLIITVLSLAAAVLVTGCASSADKVNKNIGKACEQFECQRKIIGINGITDKVLFEVEGRCSLEQNGALPLNLEVLCKHGPDNYKKHFIGLSDNVTWISTQVEGLDADEYRTRIILKPENIVPDFDLITGEQP